MMDFLQDIGLFDPTKAETGTPLYENMVLMVQRSNLSAKILTVGLVQNLAKLVVVANINKWQQIVPSDRLKKIEFVHLLGFICDRNLKIENVANIKISVRNGVWGPVEWVGDQLTGWGRSSRKQNSKIKPPCFLKFFDLSNR